MIADENVRLSLPEIFPAIKTISDERKDAEDPAPEPKKKIADASSLRSKKKWKNDTWQQDDHENCKYKEHPHDVQFVQDWVDNAQGIWNYSRTLGTRK